MPREPHGSNIVTLLLVGAAVLGGGGWLGLRAMAQSRAQDAYDAANALADCLDQKTEGRTLAAALDLMLAGDRPLAECEGSVKSLAEAEQKLSDVPVVAHYQPVLDLAVVSARLRAFTWTATAGEIAGQRDKGSFTEDIGRAANLTCLTAQKLGLDTSRDCVREPTLAPTPPTRRVAIETDTDDNDVSTVLIEAIDRDVRLFFVTSSGFWLLRSKDAGQSYRHETLKLAGGKGARDLRLAQGAEGRHYAVVTPAGEATPVTILRITKADRVEVARELELPADLAWVPAGAPVLEVHDGENLMLALALVSRDSSRGRIAYLENKRLQLRKVPEGALLAAVGMPPSVLIATAKKKSFELSSYTVPNASTTWPTPKVSSTARIESVGGLDVACGAARERYVPFLSRNGKSGTLIALSDGEPTPYLFSLAPSRGAKVVCGRCSPSLLASAPRGPELLLSAQRTLTSQALAAPIAFGQKSVWPTALATCAGDWHALTWLFQGRLFVQAVEVGTWQTSEPTLLAEANGWGVPEHVTLVATQGGVVVFWWRRAKAGQMRVEYATSKDGKTWT